MADTTPTRTKVCSKCGAEKVLDAFPLASWCADGRRGQCRECRNSGGTRTVSVKRCNTCGEMKPVSDFQKRTAAADGRDGRCRLCKGASRRAEYPKNRERVKASNRKNYLLNRTERIAKQAAWKAANPEKVRQYRQVRYAKNRTRVLEQTRAWQKANPERFAEVARRRRARKLASVVGVVDLTSLWETQDGACALCGESIDPGVEFPDPMSKSVDHIHPLSLGGSHEQSNLQWAHLRCNQRKGARPLA